MEEHTLHVSVVLIWKENVVVVILVSPVLQNLTETFEVVSLGPLCEQTYFVKSQIFKKETFAR